METDRDRKRFLKYVRQGDHCLEWIGATLPRGYGRFYFEGRVQYAHRVALKLAGHEVQANQVVMHQCDNPRCVNVAHLVIGTQSENMADAARKGRTRNVSDWRGEKNPRSKLSQEQAKALAARAKAGEPTRTLAAEFGISFVRVQQVRRETFGREPIAGGGGK